MPSHFRAAGHLIYWLINHAAGLHFAAYLAVQQALHLANIFLIWGLLRTLRLDGVATGLGTLFFSFHAVVRLMAQNPTVWRWDPVPRSLEPGRAFPLEFLRMTDDRTIYQLGDGWDRITDGARWMSGSAQAWIYAGGNEFLCNTRLRKWDKRSSVATLSVFVDGSLAAVQTFHRTEQQTSRWRVESSPSRRVFVQLRMVPDSGSPSIQVVGMGFVGRDG